MRYNYLTENTCSQKISFDLNGSVVTNIKYMGGCNGNLQSIERILDGWTVEEIENKLGDIRNQLCFPLYACSKEIVRRYKPFLDEIDLTYTQYIAMMVLWEEKKVNVKELGSRLFLDSGTLTPVLKRLEQKGLITRQRDEKDERVLIAEITKEGEALKEKAVDIPYKMAGCVRLDENDAKELYRILHTLLMGFEE